MKLWCLGYEINQKLLHGVLLGDYMNIHIFYLFFIEIRIFYTITEHCTLIESMKATSVEIVSTGVLDRNKEDYLRSKDEA